MVEKLLEEQIPKGMELCRFQHVFFQIIPSSHQKTNFGNQVFSDALGLMADLFREKNILSTDQSHWDDYTLYVEVKLHASADYRHKKTIAEPVSRQEIEDRLKEIVTGKTTIRRIRTWLDFKDSKAIEDAKQILEQAKQETFSYKLEMLVGEPMYKPSVSCGLGSGRDEYNKGGFLGG